MWLLCETRSESETAKSNQNVNEIAGLSQTTVWQRHAITEAESDWLAQEVPVALVYNGISRGDDGNAG